MRVVVIWSVMVLTGINGALKLNASAEEESAAARTIPNWVKNARWYEIDVRRFSNGEPSNDPPGSVPWPACEEQILAGGPKRSAGEVEVCRSGSFGGDLQGVRARLGYLKELGVNALCLGGIWDGDGSRVAPEVSAAGAEGDRVLTELLAEARRRGFRVVLDFPTRESGAESEGAALAVTRKWMDPNGDGDPGDGVDGWRAPAVGRSGEGMSEAFRRRWYEEVKKIHRSAIVVGEDIVSAGDVTGRSGAGAEKDGETWLAGFVRLVKSSSDSANERFVRLAIQDPAGATGGHPELPLIVQHVLPQAPWMVAGQEVGQWEGALRPMWWADMPGAKEKLPEFREELRELIRWLHSRREHYPPLREGKVRMVMEEPGKGLFAFARTLPGDEIIVLINDGGEKQKAMVPTGAPRRWIGVLVPHLALERPAGRRGEPVPEGARTRKVFRVNGSRQQADAEGKIRVWISAKSVLLIIASDRGPY